MEYEEKGVDDVGGVDDKGLTDMVAVNQEVEEHRQERMAVDV